VPCDQINIVSVALTAADERILHDALEASQDIRAYAGGFLYKGYEPFKIVNGKVEADDRVAVDIANAVNRAYSAQVVKVAAKRYGWAIKTNTQDGKITLSKRK
jgi:hypothetical protein